MKHNINKKGKANDAIAEIEKKKQKLIQENTENEKILPEKEKDLKKLIG